MTTPQDHHTELVQHANRLHQALYALATSELREVSSGHSGKGRDNWGPYDCVQEALIEVLTHLVGTRSRAEEVRQLMLDDSGEGVAYWLKQEAEQHQYELDTAHEEALEFLYSSATEWADRRW